MTKSGIGLSSAYWSRNITGVSHPTTTATHVAKLMNNYINSIVISEEIIKIIGELVKLVFQNNEAEKN